jgi:hypothetical protein
MLFLEKILTISLTKSLYLKPFNSNKILYATYDLKDKIQELQKKEIERSAKIILIIISLVLGMAVAYFVSKFVFGF